MLWDGDTPRSVGAASLGSWGVPLSDLWWWWDKCPCNVWGGMGVGWDGCLSPGRRPPAPGSRGGLRQLLRPAHRHARGPHGAHLLPRRLCLLLQQEEV